MIVSPSVFDLKLARGNSYDISVTLRNYSGTELTGLAFSANSSEGLAATLINSGNSTLGGEEIRVVKLRVTAAPNAPNTGFVKLVVSTAEGLGGQVDVNVSMVSLAPIIRTAPSYIDTGMMRGTQKLAGFTLRNDGQAPLKNARLEGPSIPWMTLTVDRNLGDVPAGQEVSVGIMLRPGTSVPPGVYDDRIVITSDNHIPYTFNIQVTVTSDAVGSVFFDVRNEWYESLPGATITLQHQTLLDLRYDLKAGVDGTVMLNDISEGRYSYNVSASGTVPYSGSFVIEPGLTTTIPLALEVNMVSIEWSVTETTIEDRYEIQVTQTFETNVPTAVLVTEPAGITLPRMQPGEVFNGEFTVTNYGLIAAFDVEISFPASFADYDIEVLTEAIPDRIEAMQRIMVPYRVTRRIQTAATSLYEEVSGLGGGDCLTAVYVGIKGKCIICPNTPAQRIVEKTTQYMISGYTSVGCPETTTSTGGAPVIVYGGSTGSGGSSGSGGQSGGGSYPSQTTPLETGNPCDCKEEGTAPNPAKPCEVCENGSLVQKSGPLNPENPCLVCENGTVVPKTATIPGETCKTCDNGQIKYLSGPIEGQPCKECNNGEISYKSKGTKINGYTCKECDGKGKLLDIDTKIEVETPFKVGQSKFTLLEAANKFFDKFNAKAEFKGELTVDYSKVFKCCQLTGTIIPPGISGSVNGKIGLDVTVPVYVVPFAVGKASVNLTAGGNVSANLTGKFDVCDLPDYFSGSASVGAYVGGGAFFDLYKLISIEGGVKSGISTMGKISAKNGPIINIPVQFDGIWFQGKIKTISMDEQAWDPNINGVLYLVEKEVWREYSVDIRKLITGE